MVLFLSLFIVISAVALPTHQSLTQPEACKVALKPLIRALCGEAGVTRASCLSQGCCFVEPEASKLSCPSSTSGQGTCYYPANCEAGEPLGRIQCGWEGIERSKCQCRGCCYDDSKAGVPFCFNPYSASSGCGEWTTYDNEFIVVNDEQLFENMTLQDCKAHCEDIKDFECNSYEYNKVTHMCTLGKITYLRAKRLGLIRQSNDYVTYSCSAREPSVKPECMGKKLDVLFAIDESSSILAADFIKVKRFAMGIAEHLHMSAAGTRIGLVTYSTVPKYHFSLHQGTSAGKTINMMNSITQSGGSTHTHSALEKILNFVSTGYGGRDDGIKVAIVQTDGKSFNEAKTKAAAAKLRQEKVKLIVFGVGEFDEKELEQIASDPIDEHIFKVDNYHQLNTVVENIVLLACAGVAAEPKPPTTPAPPKPVVDAPPFCKDIPVANRTVTPPLYMIDPDGKDFGADPFRVECDFSKDPPETIVHNNQEAGSCAQTCTEVDSGCFNKEIEYHGSVFQINKMTKHADSCRQFVKYNCFEAAIDYRTHDPNGGPYTFWTNNKGDTMPYWPGGDPTAGGCACGKTNSCATAGEKCNCDTRDQTWRSDEGTITDQTLLPLKEIRLGDVTSANKKGCFIMGPLICI